MRKVSAILFGLSIALLGLSGCKNSNEEKTYNEVGDLRVFEEPSRQVAARTGSTLWNESVPAPKPMAQKRTVQRSFVRVGDLELE